MKKLLCIFLLFLSFSFIIGCDSNKPNENSKTEEKENNDGIKDLNKPSISITLDGIVGWKAVENASGYCYIINDKKEIKTDKTKVQLEKGDSIKVKALGDGVKYLNR